MSAIFVLDRITLRPGKLSEFREKLSREYVPAARNRGLHFLESWLSPPLELHDAGNELLLLWSLEDEAAFWEMRRLHGEDPEAARWWEGSGEWVESRSRRFMKREALET